MSLMALLVMLGGCAATGPGSFEAPAGSYDAVFTAARDELRAMGFELDRVDARHGVISTRSRPSAGLATFWLAGESTPGQSIEGTINRQARAVRIRFFVPEISGGPSVAEEAPLDLRLYPGPLRVEVEAYVMQAQRPSLRVPAASIRLTSPSVDPELVDRGLHPAHAVQLGYDDRLASRIVGALVRSVGLTDTNVREYSDIDRRN